MSTIDIEEVRRAEIRFYLLNYKIFKINKDISDMTSFYIAIRQLWDYNQQLITKLAKECLLQEDYKPSLKELMYYTKKDLKISDKAIGELFGYSRQTVYENIKREDVVVYPRSKKEYHEQLVNFINSYDKYFEIKYTDLY